MPVLRDLIATSLDGEWGKGEAGDGLVPMLAIRGTDFDAARGGSLARVPVRFIKEKAAARKSLRPRDLLIEVAGGSKGRPTGRTLYVTDSMVAKAPVPLTCASFCRFIRVDEALVDPGYLFWHFQALYLNGILEKYHTQHTGVARFQWTTFADSEPLVLPRLAVQGQVAAILRCYDELIENNLRRIEILSEMAQALYREWFVEYRFPGHEDTPLVGSPAGDVPSNWTVACLGDHLELAYGKALKADERAGGAIPVYGSSGVVGWHDEYLVPGPGIVVGRKGNVGSVFWTDGDFYPIDTTFYVRSQLPLSYLYRNLQSQHFLNSDAAVPGLNRNQAYANPLIVPPDSTLGLFEEIVRPMDQLRRNLERQNENLRETRDLLLPRLVSREIDVSDLDIDTKWMAS
jgi:type I restriction enzyme S subunit